MCCAVLFAACCAVREVGEGRRKERRKEKKRKEKKEKRRKEKKKKIWKIF
jgi:hypothetical protein